MPDIITPMHDCRRWSGGVCYAAGLAAWLDASLTGVCIPAPPLDAASAAPAPLHAELVEILCESEESCRDASVAFSRWARGRQVPRARWYATTQPLEVVLRAAADWHDLTVIERPLDDGNAAIHELGRLLLTVPLPFLLLPADLPCDTPPPATIAIAWNGSREARRALHAALPLLRRASRVVLLRSTTTRQIDDASWPPAQTLDAYLAWQGIDCVPATVPNDAPETLFAAAAEVDADLLVMGAYGKGRYAEWLFGGATQYALRNARTPLLLRH
jgi:nucleotide-binding universal stress UspA family protein